MVGLPDQFLETANYLGEEEVREALRGRIFEIENSLAMYQLLENIFSQNGQETLFNREFRASLDELRERHGKPVALLAVTDQKYRAMKESEFGKKPEEPITDADVQALSGFDRFFSPEEFKQYLEENDGECGYLLYARTSDPIEKLKRPETKVEIPLLENDDTRRIIKANAVTFNIDNPAWTFGDPRRINDTKAYLPTMGMAYRANTFNDIFSNVTARKNQHALVTLNPGLQEYLLSQRVDPEAIKSGVVDLRAKPLEATYGCYGHVALKTIDGKHRQELRAGLERRGPYIIQPELATPVMTNTADGRKYTYIDRNFFTTNGRTIRFMGGFRSLMPMDTVEAHQKRVHGNGSTVWAEIS